MYWSMHSIIHPGAGHYRRTSRTFGRYSRGKNLRTLGQIVQLGKLVIGNPDEIASAALFLASGDCSQVAGAERFLDREWA